MTSSLGADVRHGRRDNVRVVTYGPKELEIGDHSELLEARKVLRIDELQVSDLVAVVAIAILLARVGEGIKGGAGCTITNCMNMDRETGGVGGGDDLVQMRLGV